MKIDAYPCYRKASNWCIIYFWMQIIFERKYKLELQLIKSPNMEEMKPVRTPPVESHCYSLETDQEYIEPLEANLIKLEILYIAKQNLI